MNAVAISVIVLAFLFGGGLVGMRLRNALPEHHLTGESQHLLETALGIIGTIGGLVLGLLVASAFGSYNAQRASLVQLSADITVLDRILAHYGPDANEARTLLRGAVVRLIGEVWPERGQAVQMDPEAVRGEAVFDKIEALKPKNDEQTSIKGEALGISLSISQLRWLMYEQLAIGFSVPLLVMLTFWFTVTFMGLGMFARATATSITALFLAAVAVSGALFLLQEMYTPFQGVMQISSGPLREALANLGR